MPGPAIGTPGPQAAFGGGGNRWRQAVAATKEKTLRDAFYETLEDVYYAEK